ncbi:MAG: Glu-tRNA(Gln) amidotransferase subunit GatE [Thermoplasmata archaeon]|nr:MAG: Glu-tRNA(Gln) amidotransferase subunit GatE [Thermoplasmata archaeon]
MNYKSLGLKVGLEIHQQLDTHKLFCNCPSELTDSDAREFTRLLKPTQSEMGEVDRAAKSEEKRKLRFKYQAPPTVCLVEADEEPPHEVNSEALDTVLEFAAMVKANFVDEVQFMRKIVIDGSNTSGFQRTALVAMNGNMNMGPMEIDGLNKIGITTICLEEDAARRIAKEGAEITYRLDRLGIPLIEIATEPDIRTPKQAKAVAERIGSLLRATKKVKRGIGTVREDLNISISEGARVEIKGVQELNMISIYVQEELERQMRLVEVKNELRKRKVSDTDFTEIKDLTDIFKTTECKVLLDMIKEGGIVIGIKMKGFSGLMGDGLSQRLETNRRGVLGPELAAYLGPLGIGGLFHSEELPGYGITNEEMEKVNESLGVEKTDAFILIAEKEDLVSEAAAIVISRTKQAFLGVPEETRDPLLDGTSKYSRPLAGEARMYPETDVPPIRLDEDKITKIQANLPELPEEREQRFIKSYRVNPQQARQLISAECDLIFEELLKKQESKKMQNIIAKILLNIIPELESEGVDTTQIKKEIIDEVITCVAQGKFAKEGIYDVLKYVVEKKVSIAQAQSDLGLGGIDEDEMNKIIESLVNERADYIKEKGMASIGPLMGILMKELKGRVDGKKVNLALKKKINEICS